eukprot:g5109.t1
MKFPPFAQTELRSQIKEARSGLRNQHGFLEMVQKVQSSVEAAMGKLAKVVKRYAHSQVHAEAGLCYQRAEREDRFLAWLREDDATLGAVEHVAFYKSFFQTQCFMHVLREEWEAATVPQAVGWYCFGYAFNLFWDNFRLEVLAASYLAALVVKEHPVIIQDFSIALVLVLLAVVLVVVARYMVFGQS